MICIEKNISVTLGQLIKQLRADRNLSQADFAHAIGVKPQSIWNIENGVTDYLKPEPYRRLAVFVKKEINELKAMHDPASARGLIKKLRITLPADLAAALAREAGRTKPRISAAELAIHQLRTANGLVPMLKMVGEEPDGTNAKAPKD